MVDVQELHGFIWLAPWHHWPWGYFTWTADGITLQQTNIVMEKGSNLDELPNDLPINHGNHGDFPLRHAHQMGTSAALSGPFQAALVDLLRPRPTRGPSVDRRPAWVASHWAAGAALAAVLERTGTLWPWKIANVIPCVDDLPIKNIWLLYDILWYIYIHKYKSMANC